MQIFVAALDWGLGHTTRLIPVIYKLLGSGHTIIIGASKKQYPLYKEHFPEILIEKLPSFQPVLSRRNSQVGAIALYLPRFLINIRLENFKTHQIVKKYKIEKLISDNRYGVHSKNTINILITHQLNLLLPKKIGFFQGLVSRFINTQIDKFTSCNVPDFEGPDSLSGELSYPVPGLKCPVNFIGPLSRFRLINDNSSTIPSAELLILISGPEKQRTLFENTILKALQRAEFLPSYFIIRGLPNVAENKLPNSQAYADAGTLKSLIINAKYIICRSGYSTVMDLFFLGKTAMLVPTPGQPEQEYLAKHLEKAGYFLSENQQNINLDNILERLDKFTPDKLLAKRLENQTERLPLENYF